MSHRNHKVFPHPVLSPQRGDYEPSYWFGAVVATPVLTPQGNINVSVVYQVECPSLLKYIEENRAACISLVECSSTYRRNRYSVSGVQDIFMLDAAELPDKFQITPYITATEDIPSFWAEEFSVVTKALVPQGIAIRAGSVLALGEMVEVEVTGEGNSIFDLAAHSDVPSGTFSTNLQGERIAINLHRDDLRRINQLRETPERLNVLRQALYLHSLNEALRGLEDHSHRRWASVLQTKLQENGIEVDEDEMSNRSEEYAQMIFQKPLSLFLDTLSPMVSDE